MRFPYLLAEHVPGEPCEATCVMAAVTAFCGLQADGSPMPNGVPHAPSRRELADELGLYIGAVRRGVRHLVDAGLVRLDDGVHAVQEAVRRRWREPRCRIRLTAELRALRMRAEPLLVSALVANHLDRKGRLVLGVPLLMQRTGLSRRAVHRALATARGRGAIHTWTFPPRWQLCLALGPREAAQEMEREPAQENHREAAQEKVATPRGGREVAHPPLAKWHRPPREVAQTPSRSGTRAQDAQDAQDHHQEARAQGRRAAAPPAVVVGGGGDLHHEQQQQPESQQPAKLPESTTAAEPTATLRPIDARAALAELREEDRRRELLTDPRPQVEKVRDLLGLVDFATQHPEQQQATAQAIADKRGDDATRFLLDELHGIAADPTANVPAVLRHRIKNGLLDSTEPATGPTQNTSRRPLRLAQHDAGEGIRAENDRRRREAQEADRERWLRDVVRCRVVTERAEPAIVAAELGVSVEKVAAIVEQEQQRCTADPTYQQQPKRGVRRLARAASDDPDRAAQREALARTLAFYEAQGKRAPSHVVDAFAAAGGAR